MKNFLLFTLLTLFTFSVKAQDVIVNQDVLNSLGSTQEASGPLFPVMPKRIVKPVVKKAPKVKKVAIKKPQVKPVKISQPKKVFAEVKKEVDQQTLQKEFDAMPTVVKKEEPQAKTLELKPQEQERPVAPLTKEEKAFNPQIKFEGYEATLSKKNEEKINKILTSFNSAKENKISIAAYNLEGQENAFKKKRQVLNHALNVRDYLISKGFNNSSVRVIEVNNQPELENIVEITEIQ